jgi:hypothetical protein
MTPFQEADRPNMKKNLTPQRSGRIAVSAKAEEQTRPLLLGELQKQRDAVPCE